MGISKDILRVEIETAAKEATVEALSTTDASFIFTDGNGKLNHDKGGQLLNSLKMYGAQKLNDLAAGGTQAKHLAEARTAIETLIAYCLTPENTPTEELAKSLVGNESIAKMYARKLVTAMDPKITHLYNAYLRGNTTSR